MKNGLQFFIGLFLVLALSWVGLVLGTQAQLGGLQPQKDEMLGKAFPERMSGLAHQGQMVYQDLGCAACHTQQVRRPDYGSDQARGWGEWQSVARNYIHEGRPQLGDIRLGPDLANYGARAEKAGSTEADLLAFLYNGAEGMPSYRFLFQVRKIVGQPAPDALQGVAAPGYELVPDYRAKQLVHYLLSLKQSYEFSEARPYVPEAQKEGAQP